MQYPLRWAPAMKDDATPAASVTTSARWLLLAHQLPTRPSHGRVKTWRRLQQIGAVPSRNSVYVLPNTPQCREDFEWIRSEIVAAGGEATVFAADALNADGDDAIVGAFRRSRDTDYAALKREANQLLAASRKRRGGAGLVREQLSRSVRTLRERFADIERIDFCNAAGRQAAGEAVASVERRLSERLTMSSRVAAASPRSATAFRNRRWVTRPRPGVDRMASAWLIRRFIDPNAAFAFVEQPSDGDTPFDMYVGEFSHQGSLCTFESLAERFGLRDATVRQIGQIVHDLDMKEAKYAALEGPAVSRMVDGLRSIHADDHVLLEQGISMFEALARSFDSTVARDSPHRVRRRRSSRSRRARR
jgi:hypothetical protein